MDQKRYTLQQIQLKGLPRLGWQMCKQLANLYPHEDVLCREIEPVNGSKPYLQQIIPPALISKFIS